MEKRDYISTVFKNLKLYSVEETSLSRSFKLFWTNAQQQLFKAICSLFLKCDQIYICNRQDSYLILKTRFYFRLLIPYLDEK